MELKATTIRLDKWRSNVGWNNIDVFIPKICPHCSFANRPIDFDAFCFDTAKNSKFFIVGHICANCHEKYFTFHNILDITVTSFETEFIFMYPKQKGKVFDQLFTDISPRFVDLYTQAFTAESNGHYDLAACGYRNAIEVLIKDFTINALHENPDEVKSLKLYGAISKFLPDIALQNSADVIRILGNDKTHYEQKYEHIEFEQLKYYMDIFEIFILAKLKALNPPVSRG